LPVAAAAMLYYLAVAVCRRRFRNLGSRIARVIAARLGWETGEATWLPCSALLEGATGVDRGPFALHAPPPLSASVSPECNRPPFLSEGGRFSSR
jgi:hypothetical protein